MKLYILSIILVFAMTSCTTVKNKDLTSKTDVGEIEIHMYMKDLKREQIDSDFDIDPIIEVTPGINGKTIFVGNGAGVISISDVPIGEYKIHPLYLNTDYDINIQVQKNERVVRELLFPATGIYYYCYNVNNVNNENQVIKESRQYINQIIQREKIVELFNNNQIVALDLISPELKNDGLENITQISVSSSMNSQYTSDQIKLDIIVNNTEANVAIAYEIKKQLDNLKIFSQSDIRIFPWKEFLAVKDSMNYQFARAGWLMDSNNIINYYKNLSWQTGYTGEEFEKHMKKAEKYLEIGNKDLLTKELIYLHEILLEEAIVLPLYYY